MKKSPMIKRLNKMYHCWDVKYIIFNLVLLICGIMLWCVLINLLFKAFNSVSLVDYILIKL